MSTSGQADRPSVLLAADPAERAGLARLLAEAGFAVTEATGAAEALRRALDDRPDVVLLGTHSGDLDPDEVARRLRADPATAAVPVVLLSAEADRGPGADRGPPTVAHVRDVIRLRRAEDQARAARRDADDARARLAAVVEASQDAVVAVDLAGTVTAWNGAAERLYGGIPAGAALGRPWTLLVPSDRRDELEAVKAGLARGEPVAGLNTVCVAPDGRRHAVSVRFAPVRDAGGTLSGILGIARDMTEQRRLEEQFLQAQKMEAVGRLAGGVAHDFNNLLTVVNGYADLLLADLGERADCAAYARAILKAGERAAALTQQLLAFGRKQIVATRLLDLNALVAHAAELFRGPIGEDILLSLDLAPGIGRVRADPNQLEQVLLNLIVNARDAMPRGGRLAITTREAPPAEWQAGDRAGPHVVLTVTDTGQGMSEEVRGHLFEPFFTTKEVGKGSGLGLATVYAIIQQAGGGIEVETTAGAGTTFRIRLPRAADPEPPGQPTVPAPVASTGQTVLLVDDDDSVRALARQVLQSAGYAVLEAGDGDAALALAERHAGRIDLLVSDVMMPGMGGRELAERLLAQDRVQRVLYLSGHTDDEALRQSVSRHEVDFLAKPFSPAVLAQKVRDILGRDADVICPR